MNKEVGCVKMGEKQKGTITVPPVYLTSAPLPIYRFIYPSYNIVKGLKR